MKCVGFKDGRCKFACEGYVDKCPYEAIEKELG